MPTTAVEPSGMCIVKNYHCLSVLKKKKIMNSNNDTWWSSYFDAPSLRTPSGNGWWRRRISSDRKWCGSRIHYASYTIIIYKVPLEFCRTVHRCCGRSVWTTESNVTKDAEKRPVITAFPNDWPATEKYTTVTRSSV